MFGIGRKLPTIQIVTMNVNLYLDSELKTLKRAVDKELKVRGVYDEVIEEGGK